MLFFLLFLIGVTIAFDKEIHSKYETLPPNEFAKYFNGLNLTWRIDEHKTFEDDHRHCSFIEHNVTYPIVTHDLRSLDLPTNFDARKKWPQCPSISKIYDQQTCGSCWMFGAATTATDRNCIHANIKVDLSEQDLGCCRNCYSEGQLCSGGFPGRALEFWVENGLVSYNCRPYDSQALEVDNVCFNKCVNNNEYYQDKNYGGRVYSVPSDEDQIKAELFNNGPIEATFFVYSDIKDYNQGVYVHKYGIFKNSHSVRMIGYGEEGGEKYWLIANSWGKYRGENGFYKIKRYQKELQLENNLKTAVPRRVSNVYVS